MLYPLVLIVLSFFMASKSVATELEDIRSLAKEHYAELPVIAEQHIEAEKEFAKRLVENVNNAPQQCMKEPEQIIESTHFIDQVGADYHKISKSACSTDKKGMRIFISFSMPENLLIELDHQAKRLGAKLVLRGLKNNSFKETVRYLKNLKDKGIAAEIDPLAFSTFKVDLVPAFVISDGKKFDKVVGNVTLRHVLTSFAGNGELPDIATSYLGKL